MQNPNASICRNVRSMHAGNWLASKLTIMLAVSVTGCAEIPLGGDAGQNDGNGTINSQTNNPPGRAQGTAPPGSDQSRPRSMVQRPRPPREGQALLPLPTEGDPNQFTQFPIEYRSIDGFGNNLANPEWGSAGEAFLRVTPNRYADGAGMPAGSNRSSARLISNICAAQSESIVNEREATDFVWQWGQFLDHDIDETPIAEPAEAFDIEVPASDFLFDPSGTGTQTIPLDRSSFVLMEGIRQQINQISAYIDASNVYGSDEERAEALRTMDGTGRLQTSAGDLLPFNESGFENAPAPVASFFLAGDIRANEQVGLTAMHTLFVREHNYWATAYASLRPDADGEEIYEFARALVAAEMQAITYREFLPVLLGPEAPGRYIGYDPETNAGIANEFAAAGYRLGHSMLSETLLRLDADGNEIENGNLALASAFFNPQWIIEDGIDPILRGLSTQLAQRVDNQIIDSVRNFLFGPPGAGGFDLAALNIQRGRDHGLPDFNSLRVAHGLQAYTSFDEISANPTVAANLAAAYDSVDEIDAWVGGLAEDHINGGLVGETWSAILTDQFSRLRGGDRFWYQRYLPRPMVQLVHQQTLSRIIRRNTEIGSELRENVFLLSEIAEPTLDEMPQLNLETVLERIDKLQDPNAFAPPNGPPNGLDAPPNGSGTGRPFGAPR